MREIKCIDESFKSLAERNPLRQLMLGQRRTSRLSLALVCIVTGPQETHEIRRVKKKKTGQIRHVCAADLK